MTYTERRKSILNDGNLMKRVEKAQDHLGFNIIPCRTRTYILKALKGMKMKTFAHLHVIPNLYDFLSSAELKTKYYEDTFVKKDWNTDFSGNIFQNMFFCVQQNGDVIELRRQQKESGIISNLYW